MNRISCTKFCPCQHAVHPSEAQQRFNNRYDGSNVALHRFRVEGIGKAYRKLLPNWGRCIGSKWQSDFQWMNVTNTDTVWVSVSVTLTLGLVALTVTSTTGRGPGSAWHLDTSAETAPLAPKWLLLRYVYTMGTGTGANLVKQDYHGGSHVTQDGHNRLLCG